MSSASKRRPRIISPFLVSTDTTDPSLSCRRTIGMPTRLFPTTDIFYGFVV